MRDPRKEPKLLDSMSCGRAMLVVQEVTEDYVFWLYICADGHTNLTGDTIKRWQELQRRGRVLLICGERLTDAQDKQLNGRKG